MPVLTPEQCRLRLAEVLEMPTLPSVAAGLQRVLSSPGSEVGEVTELLSKDVALTARILRVVNSPYYGFANQISSLARAVIVLGFNKLKTIVLTASVVEAFRHRTAVGLRFGPFWIHSLGAAIAAEACAAAAGIDREAAFAGGLLHDVGKLALAVHFPVQMQAVWRATGADGRSFREAEQAVLGFDHTEVGYWVAETWGFPEDLATAIRFHHAPARGRSPLAAVVHLADAIVRALGAGDSGDPWVPALSEEAVSRIGITPERAGELVLATADGLARGRAFFDLVRQDDGTR